MQICTRLQWRNAEVKSDSSGRRVWLPVLSLLCAWVRHLKTRTAHSNGPSNLHVRAARLC